MVSIRRHAGIYTLETEQVLPIPMDEAWTFFSTPANLARITPAHMGFRITSGDPDAMHPGQIITYTIGLAPGIRTHWVTEITHVREGRYFIDEQRFGPYAMWHHEHWFEPETGGTRVRDRVSYKLPFEPVGRFAHPLIKCQLKRIFGHRREALGLLFPHPPETSGRGDVRPEGVRT